APPRPPSSPGNGMVPSCVFQAPMHSACQPEPICPRLRCGGGEGESFCASCCANHSHPLDRRTGKMDCLAPASSTHTHYRAHHTSTLSNQAPASLTQPLGATRCGEGLPEDRGGQIRTRPVRTGPAEQLTPTRYQKGTSSF